MNIALALRTFAVTGALLLGAGAHAQSTAPACPPTARMPSAEQLQQSVRQARDRGFLWRLRKDGRSSYLYGTIHIGRFEWTLPGKSVAQALRETDTLALELDVSDPAIAQGMAGVASAPELPPPLRARLDRQFDVACLPAAALASLHPVMQALTLTVLAGRWEGLDPAFSQEGALAGFARAAQRNIVSLETLQSQLALLVPRDAQAALAMVDQVLAQLEGPHARTVLARMGAAWDAGDLAALESYDRWCHCADTDEDRAFLKRLNDDRNPHLADGIDALHGQGKKVFAAVGALHMTGPQGLPLLMARRGYQVERVVFGR